MHVVDWRDLPSRSFDEAWARERQRWCEVLSWDAADTVAQIEDHRRAGRLPGLAAVESGVLQGWMFFLVHGGTLQVGGCTASSRHVTQAFVDTLLEQEAARTAARGILLFGFMDAPGLEASLAAHGFAVERYGYLTKGLHEAPDRDADHRWDAAAALELPRLMAAAYGPAWPTRPFARSDHPEEWQEYAAQLLCGTACGAFLPDVSASVVSQDGRLEAVVLATAVAHDTVHLAQVVVAPHRHGQGLAAAMLQAVVARAARAGFTRMSLLVGDSNARARDLYERAGFVECAAFVSAGRPSYPRWSSRPALVTGGERILR